MVISNLKNPEDFGKMRQWGAISFGIMSFLGGVSLTGADKNMGSFLWIFIIHVTFALLAVVLLVFVRSLIKPPCDSGVENGEDSATHSPTPTPSVREDAPWAQALNPLSRDFSLPRETCGSCVLCGGVLQWYRRRGDRQLPFRAPRGAAGSGTLCGIARFITCAAEVPAFQVAGDLQKRYGTWILLALTQAIFVIRFLCYSALRNPWLVLLIEPLNGATFAITWSVSCIYADRIAPEGTHATMQALLEAMHFGLGCGVGSLAAGYIYEAEGAIVCFLYAGLLSCISCVLASFTFTKRSMGWSVIVDWQTTHEGKEALRDST